MIITRMLFYRTLAVFGLTGFIFSTPLFAFQERRYPPVSVADTIVGNFTVEGGDIQSVHGRGEIIPDNEIVEKLEIQRREEVQGIEIRYTRNNKPILLQQATRGCTAAAAGMLILDAGKSFNRSELQFRNLGNDENEIQDIRSSGLQAVHPWVDSIEDLQARLRHGSAIVSVGTELGGHVVVVDAISDTAVTLRDPYHGWEITISRENFLRRWERGFVVQAVEKSSLLGKTVTIPRTNRPPSEAQVIDFDPATNRVKVQWDENQGQMHLSDIRFKNLDVRALTIKIPRTHGPKTDARIAAIDPGTHMATVIWEDTQEGDTGGKKVISKKVSISAL